MTPIEAERLIERGYRAMASIAALHRHGRVVSEVISDMRASALRGPLPIRHMPDAVRVLELAERTRAAGLIIHTAIRTLDDSTKEHEAVELLWECLAARAAIVEPLVQVLWEADASAVRANACPTAEHRGLK